MAGRKNGEEGYVLVLVAAIVARAVAKPQSEPVMENS